jgi:hypothetical protein
MKVDLLVWTGLQHRTVYSCDLAPANSMENTRRAKASPSPVALNANTTLEGDEKWASSRPHFAKTFLTVTVKKCMATSLN